MDWLFLAILSTAIFTLVNFGDKFLLIREVPDYRALPIYGALISAIVGLGLWVVDGFPYLGARDSFIMLVTGAAIIWGAVLYFRAIGIEHTSTVIVLLQMQPLMVLVMSFLLLDEHITGLQLLGFVLILSASIGVSLRDAGGLRLSLAFWLIMSFNLIFSLSSVVFKYIVEDHNFAAVLVYQSWGVGLGGVLMFLLLPRYRHAFMETTTRRRSMILIGINESVVQVANGLQLLAVSLGPIALVKVVSSTQVFMGILLGWLLTVIASSIYTEDISRKSLTRRMSYAAVMFVGVLIVK